MASSKALNEGEPIVSVVILNWNGIDDTLLCIESVKKSVFNGSIEIIVVDNGSTNDSVETLKKVAGIKLIENKKNRGFAGGQVDGYLKSSGEYIVLLNNDALISSDYIQKAYNYMISDATIGAVGGRSYFWDTDQKPFDLSNEYYAYQEINPVNGEGRFVDDLSRGNLIDVNVVSGSCVMVRKKAVKEVGYLHERFFAYYEETDLFARFKRAGWRVTYSPSLSIWHKNGASSKNKSSSFRTYMLFRNRVTFVIRNFEAKQLIKAYISFLRLILMFLKKTALYQENPEELSRREYLVAIKALITSMFILAPKSFIERSLLGLSLGRSKYSSAIKYEQAKKSLIIQVDNLKELKNLLLNVKSSRLINSSEVIFVTSSSKVYEDSMARDVSALIKSARFVYDKGLFDVNPLNIAVAASSGDLLVFSKLELFLSKSFEDEVSTALSRLLSSRDVLSYFSNDAPGSPDIEILDLLIVKRDFFVNSGGFKYRDKKLCLSEIILNAGASGRASILPIISKYEKDDLVALKVEDSSINKGIVDQYKTGPLPYLGKKIRVDKLGLFIKWLVSSNYTFRHRAGRIKNLAINILKFKYYDLRVELKHIVNEAHLINGSAHHRLIEESDLSVSYMDIPVFIICRDRYTDLSKLLEWLKVSNISKIVLVDNDSIYPPLVELLHEQSFQVQLLEKAYNGYQDVLWRDGIVKLLCPDQYYVLTDPDVHPITTAEDVLSEMIRVSSLYPEYSKVGCALKIDDLPDHYKLKKAVIKWESQFWEEQVEKDIYVAGVDTTFALYRPGVFDYLIHPSLRLGGKYEARHMPWYKNSNKRTKEDVFYSERAAKHVNSWDSSELPARYEKEMRNNR
jgi:GT2 family glycosyltransferase